MKSTTTDTEINDNPYKASQKSMMIEFLIQGYMDKHNVSYEEAQEFMYGELRKKQVSKPQSLMIDGTAKL